MKKPFEWDSYSDQPAQLKDRSFKKQMRKKEIFSLLKTFTLSLFVLPFSILMMPFVKRKTVDSRTFFTMGLDYEREPQKSLEFVKELGVKSVLLRLGLWEMEKILELKEFLSALKDKQIILKIMQDREHIEDSELLKKDIKTVFDELGDVVDIFEVGTTINRAKWGFFSVNEYLSFYKTVYEQKTENIKLIGSGVIDFEYHFTAHTLFNLQNIKYDGVSALLYVDRRVYPENTQMGFSLSDKIALLTTMVWLSFKTKHKLYITETNWPLSNTKPYAPTSEYECVSEEDYANYMLRYYLLAFASQQVDSVSWHQLMANGYGLVDLRDGVRKREAFFTYKFMVECLGEAQFLRLDIKRGYYILQVVSNGMLLQIHWSLKDETLSNEDRFLVYDKNGKKVEDDVLKIGSSPLYIYVKDAI